MTTLNTSYDIDRPSGQCAATGRALDPGEAYHAALVELTAEELEAERVAIETRHKGDAEKRTKALAALGFRRLDVAAEAWEAFRAQQGERLFSHWKSTVPEPNAKPRRFVDNHVLMNLLERLDPAEGRDAEALEGAGDSHGGAGDGDTSREQAGVDPGADPGVDPGADAMAVRAGFRHAIALLLMRKKLLRFDGTLEVEAGEHGGGENGAEAERRAPGTYWRFTPKVDLNKGPLGKWDEGRALLVLDPRLSDEQMAAVTEQLGEVLHADL